MSVKRLHSANMRPKALTPALRSMQQQQVLQHMFDATIEFHYCFRKPLLALFDNTFMSSCQPEEMVVLLRPQVDIIQIIVLTVRQCGYHHNFNVKLSSSTGPKVGAI